MKDIQITTLNVGRMKGFHKRDKTFRYMRSLKSHIYCIQEHNCAQEDQETWEKQWGGKIIWNHHTAVLLTHSIKPTDFRSSPDDRILQIDLLADNKPTTITNIYAPAYPREQREFFTKFPILQAHPVHIIVGDMNIFPDATIDRSPPGIGNTHLWQHLMAAVPDMADTIRHLEPNEP